MTVETLTKLAAGIGALILAASAVAPSVIQGWTLRPKRESGKDAGLLVLPEPQSPTAADAHAVLDIADRLRAAGNTDGAKLAHQLIDAILAGPQPKA